MSLNKSENDPSLTCYQ